jgi:transposase InsO family protein
MTAKYELVKAEKANYTVTMMCALLGIARQGYHAWAKNPGPTRRRVRRESLAGAVRRLWEASEHRHGARRIHAQLAAEGVKASLHLVRSVMRDLGVAGVQPRSSRRTTVPDPDAGRRPDLVRRRFRPPVATACLVGDITYLGTGEGWLYLATVIDLTTRMVVGWQMADHMRASLVVDALEMAHRAGFVAGNAIFHSDRGSQYTSAEFAAAAKAMDVRLSVGRTGVCWDNAVAESFFSMLKNEMYHRQRFPGRAKARLAVATYIEAYYNRRRPHSTLDYRTPAQAMADHRPPVETQDLALAA